MKKTISSLQNPRFKSALKLHTSRGRNQQNRFIVFGERECRRAIASGVSPAEVYVCPQLMTEETEAWLSESVKPDVCFEINPELNAKLEFGSRQDGVTLVVERPKITLETLKAERSCLLVVLEAIENPGNLGAIIRSCDGAGVDAVVIANPQTDFFHPNCIRASMGAVFSMTLGAGDSESVQAYLRASNFQGFVAVVEAETPIHEVDFTAERCALVFGNEARGLSEDWHAAEWSPIRIPMRGIGDSLNVSVSAAIVAYEAANQRQS